MTIEITKEAFNSILGANKSEVCKGIETTEPARFIRYYAKGVNLQSVESFAACVTQYYVTDINA
jgi:hypothetical protein